MKVFDKKDWAGKKAEEIQKELNDAIQEYAKEVSELTTQEQLAEEEQKIMDEMTKVDNELNSITYPIPDSVEFDGDTFSKDSIEKEIIYFIGKNEVEWSYTLGCYQLVKFWKDSSLKEVPYKVYDSTLRLLGQVKFKGFDEWKHILAINEFLSTCHEEYNKDTYLVIYYSNLHNALMEQMKVLNEVANPEATPDTQA